MTNSNTLTDKEIGKGFFILALAFLFLVGYIATLDSPTPPRLIGIGCEGAGGDIFAFEESDFPVRCVKIEEYK